MLLKDWCRQSHPAPSLGAAQQDESRAPDDALDKSLIAELSSSAIDKMSCEELARVVTAANLAQKLSREQSYVLPVGNREAMLRLAHLARRCCRNQGY